MAPSQQHFYRIGLEHLRIFSRNPAVQKQAHHNKMSNFFSRKSLERQLLQPHMHVSTLSGFLYPTRTVDFLSEEPFPSPTKERRVPQLLLT